MNNINKDNKEYLNFKHLENEKMSYFYHEIDKLKNQSEEDIKFFIFQTMEASRLRFFQVPHLFSVFNNKNVLISHNDNLDIKNTINLLNHFIDNNELKSGLIFLSKFLKALGDKFYKKEIDIHQLQIYLHYLSTYIREFELFFLFIHFPDEEMNLNKISDLTLNHILKEFYTSLCFDFLDRLHFNLKEWQNDTEKYHSYIHHYYFMRDLISDCLMGKFVYEEE